MIEAIASTHTIEALFKQLGLDATDDAQKRFIELYAGQLDATTSLADASFWNQSQSAFLSEAISQDGAWAVAAGELDGMLRVPVSVEK